MQSTSTTIAANSSGRSTPATTTTSTRTPNSLVEMDQASKPSTTLTTSNSTSMPIATAENSTHSAFATQRSKVLKIQPIGSSPQPALCVLFQPEHHPKSFWTLNTHVLGLESFVWAIFETHEQALSALTALLSSQAVSPALEHDLKPFEKLRKVDMDNWTARWLPPPQIHHPHQYPQRLHHHNSLPQYHQNHQNQHHHIPYPPFVANPNVPSLARARIDPPIPASQTRADPRSPRQEESTSAHSYHYQHHHNALSQYPSYPSSNRFQQDGPRLLTSPTTTSLIPPHHSQHHPMAMRMNNNPHPIGHGVGFGVGGVAHGFFPPTMQHQQQQQQQQTSSHQNYPFPNPNHYHHGTHQTIFPLQPRHLNFPQTAMHPHPPQALSRPMIDVDVNVEVGVGNPSTPAPSLLADNRGGVAAITAASRGIAHGFAVPGGVQKMNPIDTTVVATTATASTTAEENETDGNGDGDVTKEVTTNGNGDPPPSPSSPQLLDHCGDHPGGRGKEETTGSPGEVEKDEDEQGRRELEDGRSSSSDSSTMDTPVPAYTRPTPIPNPTLIPAATTTTTNAMDDAAGAAAPPSALSLASFGFSISYLPNLVDSSSSLPQKRAERECNNHLSVPLTKEGNDVELEGKLNAGGEEGFLTFSSSSCSPAGVGHNDAVGGASVDRGYENEGESRAHPNRGDEDQARRGDGQIDVDRLLHLGQGTDLVAEEQEEERGEKKEGPADGECDHPTRERDHQECERVSAVGIAYGKELSDVKEEEEEDEESSDVMEISDDDEEENETLIVAFINGATTPPSTGESDHEHLQQPNETAFDKMGEVEEYEVNGDARRVRTRRHRRAMGQMDVGARERDQEDKVEVCGVRGGSRAAERTPVISFDGKAVHDVADEEEAANEKKKKKKVDVYGLGMGSSGSYSVLDRISDEQQLPCQSAVPLNGEGEEEEKGDDKHHQLVFHSHLYPPIPISSPHHSPSRSVVPLSPMSSGVQLSAKDTSAAPESQVEKGSTTTNVGYGPGTLYKPANTDITSPLSFMSKTMTPPPPPPVSTDRDCPQTDNEKGRVRKVSLSSGGKEATNFEQDVHTRLTLPFELPHHAHHHAHDVESSTILKPSMVPFTREQGGLPPLSLSVERDHDFHGGLPHFNATSLQTEVGNQLASVTTGSGGSTDGGGDGRKHGGGEGHADWAPQYPHPHPAGGGCGVDATGESTSAVGSLAASVLQHKSTSHVGGLDCRACCRTELQIQEGQNGGGKECESDGAPAAVDARSMARMKPALTSDERRRPDGERLRLASEEGENENEEARWKEAGGDLEEEVPRGDLIHAGPALAGGTSSPPERPSAAAAFLTRTPPTLTTLTSNSEHRTRDKIRAIDQNSLRRTPFTSSSLSSSSPSSSSLPLSISPALSTAVATVKKHMHDGGVVTGANDWPREEGGDPRSVEGRWMLANHQNRDAVSRHPTSLSRLVPSYEANKGDGHTGSEGRIAPVVNPLDAPIADAAVVADADEVPTNLVDMNQSYHQENRRDASVVTATMQGGISAPLPLSIHPHTTAGPTQMSSHLHFQNRPVILPETSSSFESPSLCSSSLSRSPILSYSSSPTRSHSSGEEGSRVVRGVDVDSPFALVDYSDLGSSTYSVLDISAETKAEATESQNQLRPSSDLPTTRINNDHVTATERGFERPFVFSFGEREPDMQRPVLSLDTRLNRRPSGSEDDQIYHSFFSSVDPSIEKGQYRPPQSQPASAPLLPASGFGPSALQRDITTFGMSSPSQLVAPPTIPRLAGLQTSYPTTGNFGNGLSMNNASIQALGGVSELAAIQEAIKAHNAMSQTSPQQQQHQSAYTTARMGVSSGHANRADFGVPSIPVQGRAAIGGAATSAVGGPGQLLIPTTLDNSPPTPLSHPPVVIHNNGNSSNGKMASGGGGGGLARNLYGGWQNRTNINMGPAGLFSNPAQSLNILNGRSPLVGPNIPPAQQRPAFLSPMAHASLPDHGSRQLQMKSHVNGSTGIPPLLTSPTFQAFNPLITSSMVPQNTSTMLTHTKPAPLLTPSGKTFALGGRVQNICRDEANPILMFWPDNEPLPLPCQIRPPTAVLMALGGFNGPPPPILNTGNKGPIDAQPGDWTCGKCDYLNWRRRRVCANCYPHAEGNTEGTKHSTADVQERVAILASLLLQQQRQVQVQQQQIQAQQQAAAALLASNAAAAAAAVAANQGTVHHGIGSGVSGGMSGSGLPTNRHQLLRADSTVLREGVSPGRTASDASREVSMAPDNLSRGSDLHQPLPINFANRFGQAEAALHRYSPRSPSGVDSNNLNLHAPPFAPNRSGFFEATPGSGRPSFASSRSSSSLAVPPLSTGDGSVKNSEEDTPSPLPLLPAFLQEVVNDTSESSHSSSSIRESPSPPSSASSTFPNFGYMQRNGSGYVHEVDLEPFSHGLTSGKGLRRTPPVTSGANGVAPYPLGRASQSSIWSLGFPGDKQ